MRVRITFCCVFLSLGLIEGQPSSLGTDREELLRVQGNNCSIPEIWTFCGAYRKANEFTDLKPVFERFAPWADDEPIFGVTDEGEQFLYKSETGSWVFTRSNANVEKNKGSVVSLGINSSSPCGEQYKFLVRSSSSSSDSKNKIPDGGVGHTEVRKKSTSWKVAEALRVVNVTLENSLREVDREIDGPLISELNEGGQENKKSDKLRAILWAMHAQLRRLPLEPRIAHSDSLSTWMSIVMVTAICLVGALVFLQYNSNGAFTTKTKSKRQKGRLAPFCASIGPHQEVSATELFSLRADLEKVKKELATCRAEEGNRVAKIAELKKEMAQESSNHRRALENVKASHLTDLEKVRFDHAAQLEREKSKAHTAVGEVVRLHQEATEMRKKVIELQQGRRAAADMLAVDGNPFKYTGTVDLAGRAHGEGVATFANEKHGDVYEGEWKDGRIHGKGIYSSANGEVYEGEHQEDKKHGRGTLRKNNGDVYEGEHSGGRIHGKGIYRWACGDVYEGEWRNGMKHGQGFGQYVNGDVYEGDWRDGNKHGHGICWYANGNIYEGEWELDKRSGKGTYKWADGRAEVGRYYRGDDVGEGIRWSKDRLKARRLFDGKPGYWPISLDTASRIATQIGLPVPPPAEG